MSDDRKAESPGERLDGDALVERRISPDADSSEYDFLAIIAELEGVDITELPSLYREVDHMVEALYETPPSADAQIEIAFSYAGYRVRMDQAGSVEALKVKETV